MKIVQAILIFSLSLILFSCGDDDKDEIKKDEIKSAISLKQTRWAGTFEDTEKYRILSASVGVFFYTEKDGRYSLILGWGTTMEKNEGDFNCSIDGKILTITNTGIVLDGRWLIIQSDKDKMVLEKGTGLNGAYKGTLTLERTN